MSRDLWNKRALASAFQAMDPERRRRFVLYGISNPYFDSICDGRLRSVVLGSFLESPSGRLAAGPPITIPRAMEMLDRIRPEENRLRQLAKDCLSAALGVEIIMMPGENQVELEPPLDPDNFSRQRVQKERVPVSSGRGFPPEEYDALPLMDKQALRFIAGNMNTFVIEIDKARNLLEQMQVFAGLETIERREFKKEIEELQIRFLALKNDWLFQSKDAVRYKKRKFDAA